MVLKPKKASSKKPSASFRKRQPTHHQIVLNKMRDYIARLPSIRLEQAVRVAEDFRQSMWLSERQKQEMIVALSKKTGFSVSLLVQK